MWFAQNRNGMFVFYNERWMDIGDAVIMVLQNLATLEQQKQMNPYGGLSQSQYQLYLMNQQFQLDMARIQVQPSCNFSYNGCR